MINYFLETSDLHGGILSHMVYIWSSQCLYIFFYQFFFLTNSDNSRDRRGREGTIFCSYLPLPLAQQHTDIYLQLY